MTRSTTWPINWTYEGYLEMCPSYRGRGRAVLGQLKNITYGGANLGQNALTKKFDDGVVITARILPGIDKVHIYVPPPISKKKEEEKYIPYFWVGAKITNGGLFRGNSEQNEDTQMSSWNDYDMFVVLSVYEPPQASKQGQGWSAYDPNETQLICSFRDQLSGWQPWICTSGECWPLGTHYWNSFDPVLDNFGRQVYVKRITRYPFGKMKYPGNIEGTSIFTEYLVGQHTDDGLRSGGYLNPYDPLWNGKDSDDDHIWERTAWCDPLGAVLEQDRAPPIKYARYTVPSGVTNGAVRSYPLSQNDWNEYYTGDDAPNIKATILPGNYVVKVSLLSGSACPEYDLPVDVEIEVRVGHPSGGKMTVVNKTVTINADPKVTNYFTNCVPYGFYRETHLREGELDAWGVPVPKGYGPATHSPGANWLGAFLVDAFNGVISTVNHFDFSDDKEKYASTNDSYGNGPFVDYPYGSNTPYTATCYQFPCVAAPCTERSDTVYSFLLANKVDLDNDEGLPWVERTIIPTDTVFSKKVDNAIYAKGLKATVICSWNDYEGELPFSIFTYTLYSYIMICDDEYPDYNGEVWLALEYGVLEGDVSMWGGDRMSLGDTVYILLPQANDAFKVVPEDYLLLKLLRKDGPGTFFQNTGPPDGY